MLRTLSLITLLMAPFSRCRRRPLNLGQADSCVIPHGGGDCRELSSRAACTHKERTGRNRHGQLSARYRELCAGNARSSYHHRWHGYEEY